MVVGLLVPHFHRLLGEGGDDNPHRVVVRMKETTVF